MGPTQRTRERQTGACTAPCKPGTHSACSWASCTKLQGPRSDLVLVNNSCGQHATKKFLQTCVDIVEAEGQLRTGSVTGAYTSLWPCRRRRRTSLSVN